MSALLGSAIGSSIERPMLSVGGIFDRYEPDAEVSCKATATFGHDLIVVPPKDGFEQGRKQIHPALRRGYRPFVLDMSGRARGAESPAPNATQLADRDALQ